MPDRPGQMLLHQRQVLSETFPLHSRLAYRKAQILRESRRGNVRRFFSPSASLLRFSLCFLHLWFFPLSVHFCPSLSLSSFLFSTRLSVFPFCASPVCTSRESPSSRRRVSVSVISSAVFTFSWARPRIFLVHDGIVHTRSGWMGLASGESRLVCFEYLNLNKAS